jgi:hypothetical protein
MTICACAMDHRPSRPFDGAQASEIPWRGKASMPGHQAALSLGGDLDCTAVNRPQLRHGIHQNTIGARLGGGSNGPA